MEFQPRFNGLECGLQRNRLPALDKRFRSAESGSYSNFNMPVSSPNGIPEARSSIGH
jgi:hypothetical protein